MRRYIAPLALAAGILASAACAPPVRAGEVEIPARSETMRGEFVRDLYLVGPETDSLVLSRRGIPWGQERALLDGRRLERDRDYSVDTAAGLVRLLGAGRATRRSVLVLVYSAPAVLVEPNLTLGDDEAATQPGSENRRRSRTALGESRLGQALATELRAAAAGLPGSGEQVSADRSTTGGLREQLQSGLRLTEADESFTGGPRSEGNYQYVRTDAIDPSLRGLNREEFDSHLALPTGRFSRLVMDTHFMRRSPFAGAMAEEERRRIQFEQTWGKSSVAMMWDHRRSNAYGVGNGLDALTLSASHRPGSSSSVEGLLAYENSLYRGWNAQTIATFRQLIGSRAEAQASILGREGQFAGRGLESGLSLALRPGRSIDSNLDIRQSSSDRYGNFSRIGGDVGVALNDRIQLSMQANQRTSERYGAASTFGIGMAARPTTRSLLEAAFSESTGSAVGRERTGTLRLALLPSESLRVQLGVDRLVSDRDGIAQNALWLVTIGRERYLRFEGYSGLRTSTTGPSDLLYADSLYRMEVRPVGLISFSGSLRKVGSSVDDRSVGAVGTALYPLRGVTLEALYRRPLLPGALAADPAGPTGSDLRLMLAPVGGFRVFGQLSSRPEDEHGGLLQQFERTVGLETRLGSLTLQGSFSNLEGPAITQPGRRTDLMAIVRMGTVQMFGGVRREESPLASLLQRDLLRVGFTHQAGENFYLLLEGQVGYGQDTFGGHQFNPQDSRAQARVGVRF